MDEAFIYGQSLNFNFIVGKNEITQKYKIFPMPDNIKIKVLDDKEK